MIDMIARLTTSIPKKKLVTFGVKRSQQLNK